MNYIVQCKFCGAILLKTNNPLIGILPGEIKCPNPNCKKLLKMPNDIIINLEKRRKGLDKASGDRVK